MFGSGPSSNSGHAPVEVLDGIAGSPGLAIGKSVILDTRGTQVTRRHIKRADAEAELERFRGAVQKAVAGLRETGEGLKSRVAKAEASILEAYILMLEDDALLEDVGRRVGIDLQGVEWAVDVAIHEMAEQLRASRDPYLQERSRDFDFIGVLLQRALSGRAQSMTPYLEEPSIIIAHDLSPAETASLDKEKVLALVTESGSRTSHTAILARALEIPAVVGVRDILKRVGHHDVLIVDGLRGRVTLYPTQEVIEAAWSRAQKHLALARDLHAERDRPACTQCGVRLHIRANIELPQEADIALYEGAEGIGLYRTEFLYVDRKEPPSEDEQFTQFRNVLTTMGSLPVTLRTFDLGGDKFVASVISPRESNPALGMRAVRLSLAHPELFMVQLRAMVRASAFGPVSVMIPMISRIEELRRVRAMLDRAIEAVDKAGHERAPHIALGAMIEVPAAALKAAVIAEEAEFLCIGTNDLVQYALAADRTNREMAELASPFDPAILDLIQRTVVGANQWNRPVSVCGAMASDPFAAVLLLGLGVRDLSMEASAIGEIKAILSRVSLAEAQAITLKSLAMKSATEVESHLIDEFGARFADLLTVD